MASFTLMVWNRNGTLTYQGDLGGDRDGVMRHLTLMVRNMADCHRWTVVDNQEARIEYINNHPEIMKTKAEAQEDEVVLRGERLQHPVHTTITANPRKNQEPESELDRMKKILGME